MPQITTNFTKVEVACQCGCGRVPTDTFMTALQNLRNQCGFPLKINSAFRCATHNAAVGGAGASTHMKGIAADIGWSHLTGEQRHILLTYATKVFNGIGIHEQFLHVDLRPVPIVFFYPR